MLKKIIIIQSYIPNKMNNETTKYIEYNNYKSLEKEINKFIDNGGV